jgi:hypothetical protein
LSEKISKKFFSTGLVTVTALFAKNIFRSDLVILSKTKVIQFKWPQKTILQVEYLKNVSRRSLCNIFDF